MRFRIGLSAFFSSDTRNVQPERLCRFLLRDRAAGQGGSGAGSPGSGAGVSLAGCAARAWTLGASRVVVRAAGGGELGLPTGPGRGHAVSCSLRITCERGDISVRRGHTHTCTCAHMCTHACTHRYTQVHTCAHTTQAHMHTQTRAHVCVHACAHVHAGAHTQMHAHAHTSCHASSSLPSFMVQATLCLAPCGRWRVPPAPFGC